MAVTEPTPWHAMVGRYALADEIGSGGMAKVHLGLAGGPGGFCRVVAVKRLQPAFASDPEFTAMLIDEARLAACVHHPNVVSTLDVVARDGELFLVLEYVHGESLARLLRGPAGPGGGVDRPVPPPIAVAVFVDVLQGLHAAHEAQGDDGAPLGLVHRDVSPHNVLVGADGSARVFDFGIAKAAGRAQLTREGEIKGKLAYMAPEQLQHQIGRTTDVYAAGVCLWEALTGVRLFASDNESTVLAKVMAGLVDPPTRYVADLPPALEQVVLCALSRDPAERFATARDMARALEAAVVPASKVDVGAWVEAHASATLAARAALVARVEATPWSGEEPPPAPLAPSTVPTASSDPEQVDTSVDAVKVPSAPPPAPPASVQPSASTWLRPSVVLAALGALTLLLVVLAFFASPRRDPGARVELLREGSSSASEPAVPPQPEPPLAIELPAGPPVDGPSAPAALAAPKAPAVTRAPPTRRLSSPASRRASGRADCSPPYSVDANGARRYRKECFE